MNIDEWKDNLKKFQEMSDIIYQIQRANIHSHNEKVFKMGGIITSPDLPSKKEDYIELIRNVIKEYEETGGCFLVYSDKPFARFDEKKDYSNSIVFDFTNRYKNENS